MARAIWKGSISFGLVTIPVALYPAVSRTDLAFKMLDKQDFNPVREERKNAEGNAVAWEDVIKGYEYEKGRYVVLSDEDFRRANVEATQSIDIVQFVDADAIDPIFFDKPYYLEPGRQGRKAYALLRETLRRSGKVGVARLVIRTRQHVAAVRPEGKALVADLLRYSYEIRDPEQLDLPSEDLGELGVSQQEIDMASQLVGSMVAEWDPAQFRDTYRDDILKMIDEKVSSGQTHEITPGVPAEERAEGGQVVDIMSLLKRSLEQQKEPAGAGAGGGGRKSAPRKR